MSDRLSSLVGRIVALRAHGWSLLAELVRLPLSITVFLILTQVYDVAEYGVLVGTSAVLIFLVPYATIGASYLVLERVAGDGWGRDHALRRAFGTVATGGMLCTAVLLAARPFVLPQIPWGTLLLLCLAEVVAAGIVEAQIFAAIAEERLAALAIIRTVTGSTRVVAALGLLVLTDDPPIWCWAALALAAGTISMVAAGVIVHGQLLIPSLPRRADVARGVPFALGFSADKFRDGVDTWLLVRIDRASDAGIYAASARIVWTAAAPITAAVSSTNARFFAAANRSRRDAQRLARRMTAIALAYTSAAWLVLALASGLLAAVLGDSYDGTAGAIRMMSVYPVLLVLEVFSGMGLTAIGLHRHRVALNLGAAALNVVLDLIWIDDHGYRGAVAATIISAAAYGASLWTILEVACRRAPDRSRLATTHVVAGHLGPRKVDQR